jgi:hypothetical protein
MANNRFGIEHITKTIFYKFCLRYPTIFFYLQSSLMGLILSFPSQEHNQIEIYISLRLRSWVLIDGHHHKLLPCTTPHIASCLESKWTPHVETHRNWFSFWFESFGIQVDSSCGNSLELVESLKSNWGANKEVKILVQGKHMAISPSHDSFLLVPPPPKRRNI